MFIELEITHVTDICVVALENLKQVVFCFIEKFTNKIRQLCRTSLSHSLKPVLIVVEDSREG